VPCGKTGLVQSADWLGKRISATFDDKTFPFSIIFQFKML
jgi:hypothetical protein